MLKDSQGRDVKSGDQQEKVSLLEERTKPGDIERLNVIHPATS